VIKTYKFPGGAKIHEGENMKSAIALQETVILDPPARVIIPMTQHIGTPAKCIVGINEKVKIGQLIGEAVGSFSANVHASISGTVTSITQCLMPNGHPAEAVIINNDYSESSVTLKTPSDPMQISRDEFVSLVHTAGIVGLSGSGCPTAVKFASDRASKIDTLIINGAECEPYLSVDHRTMLDKPDRIIDAISIITTVFSIPEAFIGIEENKDDAIRLLQSKTTDSNIKVVRLPAKYPQGGEKQLIYALTKKRVKSGTLPIDAGIIVINVNTAAAISQVLRQGKTLTERVVTVAGMVAFPRNYQVRIGTPLEMLIDAAGGLSAGVRKVIYGGPMMGQAVSRLDIPITKTCTGIVAMGKQSIEHEELACIRCGRCFHVCPIRLMPMSIDHFFRANAIEEVQGTGVADCIECGSCSYICPSKRALTQSCSTCKAILKKRNNQSTIKPPKVEKEA